MLRVLPPLVATGVVAATAHRRRSTAQQPTFALQREFTNTAVRDGAFTVAQWNLLADGLSGRDPALGGFTHGLDARFLQWEYRQPLIARELAASDADIVMLEECDHPEDVRAALPGHHCIFQPKRHSPCLANSPLPDGCLLAVRAARFEVEAHEAFFLREEDNQCCVTATLRDVRTGKRIVAAVTHLKAAKDAAGEAVRTAQARHVALRVERAMADGGAPHAVLGCDLNATPTSKAYALLLRRGFRSSFAQCMGAEPAFTTCKQRSAGAKASVIDYLFAVNLDADAVLRVPAGEPAPLPTAEHPSDHLLLVARYSYPAQ